VSKKLARPKVLDQIEKLAPTLKRIALRHLNTPIRRRHGSQEYARQFPTRAVSLKEKVDMKALHKAGLSFRACEEVFHLIPNSGNDAQRCVKIAARALRTRKVKATAIA